MSNARNLAKVAVDANGDIGTASLDNIDLTTRVAKTGDTMTGSLSMTGASGAYHAYDRSGNGKSFAFYSHDDKGAFYSSQLADDFMVFDHAGRVTMPYQPAFSASSTYTVAYQTITPSAPFPFDGTRINIGGHYSTSTYRFTAPINGLYEFHMNVFYETGQGASNHDSTFYVNGAQLVTTTASGVVQCASRSGTDRTTSMLTALIQLSTNDYVEVRARSTSSGGIFGPHSYFSGRLVG